MALASSITRYLIVEADGEPVRSLPQLIEAIESRVTGLLVLETQDGKQIVLDRERARREGPAILGHYQIPSDRSEDLHAMTTRERTGTALAAGPALAAPDPAPR